MIIRNEVIYESIVVAEAVWPVYLVRHLTDDCGYEVTVTKTEKEQLVMDNAVVKNLDILDIGQIVGLLKAEQPDYIFHLAAQSSVAYSWKNCAYN